VPVFRGCKLLAVLTKAITVPSALITGALEEALPPPVPALLMLTSCVVLVARLRAKTSWKVVVVFRGCKLLAALRKATTVPSALILGAEEAALPLPVPALLMLISCVVPVVRFRANTAFLPAVLVFKGCRLLALLTKATTVPLALITGAEAAVLP